MNKTDLIELIRNGESSGVEFKRSDVRPERLATEIAALLNLEGGHILLGVEDDGSVSGLTCEASKVEEWVMETARTHIRPATIPYWETVDWREGKTVGIVSLPSDAPDKPYKAKRGKAWGMFVRVGSSSREASRDEEGRLYQSARIMRYDIKPVLETGLEELDLDRIGNYFRVIQKRDVPTAQNTEEWRRVLVSIDLLAEAAGTTVGTVAGLLLFGKNPNRRLPQSGITAAAFPENEKAYNTVDEELIRGPLVPMLSAKKSVVDKGVIDRAVDFVARNMGSVAWLDGGRRRRKKSLPRAAVRETIVNAVAHRDYTLVGTDIEVSLYRDRLEVISPGRLPNGVTVEKMKEGLRAARNELLKEILRDYGYVEHFGMGVRNRIIRAMRDHNGTEPDLIEEEHRFIVRLWKEPKPS